MRKNLTAEEAEVVCAEANKAAKKFVRAVWQSNWNAAALDHLKTLNNNMTPASGENGHLKIVESQARQFVAKTAAEEKAEASTVAQQNVVPESATSTLVPDEQAVKHNEAAAPAVEAPEVKTPVTPEAKAPVTPEAKAPVTPEVQAPVTPEVKAPVTPEVKAPVTPEVQAPVTPEVKRPLTAAEKAEYPGFLPKSSDAQKQADEYFLEVARKMQQLVLETLASSVEGILSLSSHFLEDDAEKALKEFYDLYFSGNETQKASDAQNVNDEVDRIMQQLETGGLDAMDDVVEDEEEKQRRLGISGIQKRLETIISLDESLREKLAPVLTSMQFEDLTRHRLNNLEKIWMYAIIEMNSPRTPVAKMHTALLKNLTSIEELKLYADCCPDAEIPESMLVEAEKENDGVMLF